MGENASKRTKKAWRTWMLTSWVSASLRQWAAVEAGTDRPTPGVIVWCRRKGIRPIEPIPF
jgi:hypothetical protein